MPLRWQSKHGDPTNEHPDSNWCWKAEARLALGCYRDAFTSHTAFVSRRRRWRWRWSCQRRRCAHDRRRAGYRTTQADHIPAQLRQGQLWEMADQDVVRSSSILFRLHGTNDMTLEQVLLSLPSHRIRGRKPHARRFRLSRSWPLSTTRSPGSWQTSWVDRQPPTQNPWRSTHHSPLARAYI